MSRQPRLVEPGSIHHLTAHGVDARALFADDLDRSRFVGILADVSRAFDWRCLAFCLLSTHYHLLIEEGNTPISKVMHLLNSRYSRHANLRCARRGHVFEGRYHDRRVTRDAHLLEVIRYIALNPCAAGACSSPEEWSWGSYRALVGLAKPWSFVHSARVLSLFAPGRDVAIQRVRQFVEQVPGTVPGTWATPDARRR